MGFKFCFHLEGHFFWVIIEKLSKYTYVYLRALFFLTQLTSTHIHTRETTTRCDDANAKVRKERRWKKDWGTGDHETRGRDGRYFKLYIYIRICIYIYILYIQQKFNTILKLCICLYLNKKTVCLFFIQEILIDR